MRFHAALLLVTLVTADTTWANNNLFLPGDAYFPTQMKSDAMKELESADEGTFEFKYSNLGGYSGAFCGYAGYERAKIPAINKAFLAHFKQAFEKMHSYEPREYVEMEREGKKTLVETNPVRILIYPEKFEKRGRVLGLRYNENWVAEAVKFGHKPQHLRLCCLLKDPRAVELSWRDAPFVEPLNVTLPDVEREPVPRTEAPVVVEGPVKVFLFGSVSLDRLWHPETYDVLFVVDSNGVTELYYTEQDGWQRETEEGENTAN